VFGKQKAQVLTHLGSLPGGGRPQQEKLGGSGQGLGLLHHLGQ
jgi:hypothetical protein